MFNYKYENITTCDSCREYIHLGERYTNQNGSTFESLSITAVTEYHGDKIFCDKFCYERYKEVKEIKEEQEQEEEGITKRGENFKVKTYDYRDIIVIFDNQEYIYIKSTDSVRKSMGEYIVEMNDVYDNGKYRVIQKEVYVKIMELKKELGQI